MVHALEPVTIWLDEIHQQCGKFTSTLVQKCGHLHVGKITGFGDETFLERESNAILGKSE